MRTVVIVLASLLAGCGARPPERVVVVPARAAPAASKPAALAAPNLPNAGKVRVRILGTKEVPEPELHAVLCIDKPGCAPGASNRDVLERDALLIQAALYDRGYVQSTVAEPLVEAASDGAIEVTFKIEEKERFKVGAVDVHEVDAANKPTAMLGGDAKVRAMFTSRTGEWFSRKTMVEDLSRVRTHYRDAGYAFVEADPETELDVAARTIGVRVPIKRGPIVTIEKVTVTPGSAAQAVVPVAQRVGVFVGMKYAETPLENLKKELSRAGVLADIVQGESKGHADRVTITVEVH